MRTIMSEMGMAMMRAPISSPGSNLGSQLVARRTTRLLGHEGAQRLPNDTAPRR